MSPRQEFLAELKAAPALLRQLTATLAQRLLASAQREGALAFLAAPARLARALVQIVAAAGGDGQVIASQEALAQRIGVTRQTAARILGEWRRQGWIRTGRGRVTLVDRQALAEVAG